MLQQLAVPDARHAQPFAGVYDYHTPFGPFRNTDVEGEALSPRALCVLVDVCASRSLVLIIRSHSVSIHVDDGGAFSPSSKAGKGVEYRCHGYHEQRCVHIATRRLPTGGSAPGRGIFLTEAVYFILRGSLASNLDLHFTPLGRFGILFRPLKWNHNLTKKIRLGTNRNLRIGTERY